MLPHRPSPRSKPNPLRLIVSLPSSHLYRGSTRKGAAVSSALPALTTRSLRLRNAFGESVSLNSYWRSWWRYGSGGKRSREPILRLEASRATSRDLQKYLGEIWEEGEGDQRQGGAVICAALRHADTRWVRP